ncbi:olfactory receptor 2C1-like [Lissotriton helveticus]
MCQRQMLWNRTTGKYFILTGFSLSSDVQVAVFAGFLLIYLIALFGNLIVIAVIRTTKKLHNPMYFFLCFLSFLDIVSVSVTVPRMLKDLWTQQKHISFHECITQVFVIFSLTASEALLLTVMSYDRYTAICHPLNYTTLMSRQLCINMICLSLMGGMLFSFVNTFLVSQLPFCGHNRIDNFLCEFPALLKLACSDTLINEIVIFILAGGAGSVVIGIILTSYIHIIRVILNIPSAEGKRKVFSTCSAHLMVVFLFFGTGAATHLTPPSSQEKPDKLASLFYTVFTPMLNPVIYSLRNEDVKQALGKAFHKQSRY